MTTRAPTDDVQLKFRVREGLRARLEESAQQKRVSLNAEITDRLEMSFAARPAARDVMQVCNIILEATHALNSLQAKTLELTRDLETAELKNRALQVVEATLGIQKLIYEATEWLLHAYEGTTAPPGEAIAEAMAEVALREQKALAKALLATPSEDEK